MSTHSSILAWKIHGRRSLGGYSPPGPKESDMTEQLHFHFHFLNNFQIYIVVRRSPHAHCTLTFFFSLSIHFHVLVVVNSAAVSTAVQIYVNSLPWDVHAELGLLDHVVLFLYF